MTSTLDHAKALCLRAGVDFNDVVSIEMLPGDEVAFRVYVRNEVGTPYVHQCSVQTCGGTWPFYCPKRGEVESEIFATYMP